MASMFDTLAGLLSGKYVLFWWENIKAYIKQHRVAIVVIAIVLVVVIVLIVGGYRFGWTGFSGYHKVSTATETTASPPKITRTEEDQPGKTLWDWLQLLIVPLVLAIGGFSLSQIQKTTEQRSTTDNQREAALQAYIDKISELLLEKKLRESAEGDEVRTIARVRTITILFQLDPRRLGSVFTFLHEAGLISNKPNSNIVSLSKVNLSGVNLSNVDLSNVDLSYANLSNVDLSYANLSNAHLSYAILRGATLYSANLNFANLSHADLVDANLNFADLSNVDLSNAGLSRTSLGYAKLGGAKLDGTILFETDFTHAFDITKEELEKQAGFLQDTTMPDGSKHP